jgi:K+-transporting ATPase ATPase C chain
MKEIKTALMALLLFTLITGFAYPFLITGMGMIFFQDKSSGSLLKVKGNCGRFDADRTGFQ